jgi:2-polyprenyl-3-methyl-5-hydroxy-6-metoxy-1,4-benzoquinol methylase
MFNQSLSSCPICGEANIRPWLTKIKDDIVFNIWECATCRSGFLNPRPKKEYLDKIYLKSYQGYNREISLYDILEDEREYPNATFDALRIIGIAKKLIGSSEEKLKALDIGSGYGFFSQGALKLGFEVTAISPGKFDNEVFAKMNNFKPIENNFEDMEFNDVNYDLVILSQVLEHILDPYNMLIKINRLISPDGILALAVPNINSFLVKIYGQKESSCFWIPQHVTYFSEKGLHFLLERAGFKIVQKTFITRIPYNIISKKLHLQGSMRELSNKFIKYIQKPFVNIIDISTFGIYINIWAKKIL